MFELELRAKIINKKQLINKLNLLGVKFICTKTQIDTYFGSIELYKKLDYTFLLRLRDSDKKLLTYKQSTNSNGIYVEHETQVENLTIYQKIFESMGFDHVITVNKKRETYKYNDISINIDTFKKFGTFVEFELISESQDKTMLFELLNNLKIEKTQIIEQGYITLFLEQSNSPYTMWIRH